QKYKNSRHYPIFLTPRESLTFLCPNRYIPFEFPQCHLPFPDASLRSVPPVPPYREHCTVPLGPLPKGPGSDAPGPSKVYGSPITGIFRSWPPEAVGSAPRPGIRRGGRARTDRPQGAARLAVPLSGSTGHPPAPQKDGPLHPLYGVPSGHVPVSGWLGSF